MFHCQINILIVELFETAPTQLTYSVEIIVVFYATLHYYIIDICIDTITNALFSLSFSFSQFRFRSFTQFNFHLFNQYI